jgi:hypothetical protein
VSPELELGVEQVLAGRGTQLFEPRDLDLRERLEGEVRKRRPSPESQGFAEQRRSPPSLLGLTRLGDEALEAVEIDLLGVEDEPIPRCVRLDGLGSQLLAEARDEVLERADRGLRRFSGPQLLDEPVGRDDLADAKQEQSQQGPLLRTAELELPAVDQDLERPEDAELDWGHLDLFYHCHKSLTSDFA